MAVLLTWNVAGRVGANQERQIAALAEQPFDVLCLQEITPRTRERWLDALAELGLHVAVSDWPAEPRGSRRFAVLVAGRDPVRRVPGPDLPWPERHLAVRTAPAGREVEVHTLHAPLSSKEQLVKVRTLEALYAALAGDGGGGSDGGRGGAAPRILAGDLNTPRYESREGEIVSRLRPRVAHGAPQRPLGDVGALRAARLTPGGGARQPGRRRATQTSSHGHRRAHPRRT